MIPYVAFEVRLHGLSLRGEADIEALRQALNDAIKRVHPSLRFDGDGDVEVEVIEHAGLPTNSASS